MLEPNKVPKKIDSWFSHGVMFTENDSVWQHEGCRMAMKQHIGIITYSTVKNISCRKQEQ